MDVDPERLRDVCERWGVRLEVFGSLPQGIAQPDSDIDLLYALASQARCLDLTFVQARGHRCLRTGLVAHARGDKYVTVIIDLTPSA